MSLLIARRELWMRRCLLTVPFMSKVFNRSRLVQSSKRLGIVLTARRHCCIACGGDVCFINRLAPTPETRTHLQPLLSLHLRPCCITTSTARSSHDNLIQSPRGRPSFVYRLLSPVGLLTLNPFSVLPLPLLSPPTIRYAREPLHSRQQTFFSCAATS
jgi:hypothetical protein